MNEGTLREGEEATRMPNIQHSTLNIQWGNGRKWTYGRMGGSAGAFKDIERPEVWVLLRCRRPALRTRGGAQSMRGIYVKYFSGLTSA